MNDLDSLACWLALALAISDTELLTATDRVAVCVMEDDGEIAMDSDALATLVGVAVADADGSNVIEWLSSDVQLPVATGSALAERATDGDTVEEEDSVGSTLSEEL